MCEFCENGKNMAMAAGNIRIERNKYFVSGFRLTADNSGGEYGDTWCNIEFCPVCGRKLTDDEETKSTEEILEELKNRLTTEQFEGLREAFLWEE